MPTNAELAEDVEGYSQQVDSLSQRLDRVERIQARLISALQGAVRLEFDADEEG